MKLHRFIGKFDLSKRCRLSATLILVNQCTRNVLAISKIGDELVLCDGKLDEAVAKILLLVKDKAELEILEIIKNKNEPEKLCYSLLLHFKKENFELAVQKAVEVGVKEIVPIITTRTVKLGLNYERPNKIIKEAMSNLSRGVLPILRKAVNFDEAVKQAKSANNLNLFFQAGYPSIVHKQADLTKCAQCKIGVFVDRRAVGTKKK